MNRTTYSALLAQYATPEVSGDGRVSWDGGVKCVMPSVKLYGKCEQETLTGKNLWTTDAEYPIKYAGIDCVLYDTETQTYEIPAGDSMSISQSIYTLPEPIPAGTTVTIKAFFDSGQMTGTISFGGYHNGTSISWQGWINFAKGINLAGKTYTETFVTTDTVTDFWAFLYSNAVVTETIRFRMLYVIGDSAGDYEPYTGGLTMPSPALPSPVKCNNGTFRATDAEGAYAGGQAAAPELLAIPGTDIRDEWDAQTGLGIRRCGQYTFSGAEPFVLSGGVTLPDYNVYYAYAAVPNVPAAANNPGLCTHLNRKPSMYGNEMGVIFGVSNNQIYFSVPKETYPDAETWKAYLAAQYAAGTPVKIVYIIAEPEPFYSPPARLTMPRGSGQIIQTGGDVADCPITARYLTHS